MTETQAPYDLIPTHVTSVRRVERLSAGFVRITFGGGLERFRPIAPDQFVYVLVPPPGVDELHVDIDFRWSTYYEQPEAERAVGAYYTVRHHRLEADEIDCDVFLHDPAGHASRWAAERAAVGAPAALWGPRTTWVPPADTERWLLVVDDTGIPATEAILEALPASAEVTVVVEASDPAVASRLDRIIGTHRSRAVIRRLRPPGEAGTTDHLIDAVRSLSLTAVGLYAWGGAESRAMRDVRRHLRGTVRLTREQVSMTPYWRHRLHAGDTDAADD